MANTTTANYGWQMPDPGGSPNTWGNTLNATTQAIDAKVYQNEQAGVPIGSGALWFAATPPTNWLICDGSSLSTTTYAALFAVIGYTFGGSGANFNLPPQAGRFPFGVGSGVALAATGGEATHVLTAAEMPVHPHPIVDVAHNHAINDPEHVHAVGDPTHAHGASESPHAHGGVVIGLTGPGSGSIAGAVGGGNLQMGNTAAAQAGVTVNAAATGIGIYPAATGVYNSASGTGLSTTQNAGGGGAHNTMPPFIGVNFIIKFA